MRRRERLAQRAAIERINGFIGKAGDALVPLAVYIARLLQQFLDLLRLGVQRHLDLVHDSAEVVVEGAVEYVANVAQPEALGKRPFAEADPGDVALALVLKALGAIEEMMDLPFEHRLEVFLHLAAGHLYDDGKRDLLSFGIGVKVLANNGDFAILDFVRVLHGQPLETHSILAAELGAQVRPAHDLASNAGP